MHLRCLIVALRQQLDRSLHSPLGKEPMNGYAEELFECTFQERSIAGNLVRQPCQRPILAETFLK
jgi:hypothetical protein